MFFYDIIEKKGFRNWEYKMHNIRKITSDLFYIGCSDRKLSLFESAYPVKEGMAYNSYLVRDDTTILLDTVDRVCAEQFYENLDEALGRRHLDYIVVQHMEPDHCALLEEVVKSHNAVKIVCTQKTVGMIKQFFTFDIDSRVIVVKEGDILNTGRHEFQFIMAPMVHWPEVMVEYEKSEKILFSADGFGKFGALDADEDWACEARRYYFNIVGKYGAPVQALLKKAAALEINTLCPLHGPVLTENLGYYIDLYDTWSSYRPEKEGVFIACASIYGNTKKAALRLKELLEAKGVKTAFSDITRDDIAEAVEDAFKYSATVLAASSYDGGVFPPMEALLCHLKSKAFQNRRIGIIENGSWAPCAARAMKGALEGMKNIELCENTVTIKSAFKQSDMPALEALAAELCGE